MAEMERFELLEGCKIEKMAHPVLPENTGFFAICVKCVLKRENR